MSSARPFDGLRVLDLSREIAGAYATRLLCDQGACVLKVEAPGQPDPLRRRSATGSELPPGEDAPLFRFLNAGKQAALCDSTKPAQRAQLLERAREANLLVESGPPGELEARLAPVETLQAQNPELSIISISPWGRRGPWAGRPASEWTLQAATGFMARRGTPARGPVGAGGRLGEYAAGAFAAVAALAAWRGTRAGGPGRHIDLSIFEAMLCCTTQYWDLNQQFLGGQLQQYVDTPSIEACADGWVGFATPTAAQWRDFCLMIERPELAQDERFRDANARMQHLDFIRAAIHDWTRTRCKADILELCELRRIPCAPVCNGATLLETDHFQERGVFVPNPHGFLQPRVPFRLDGAPATPVAKAPGVGEQSLRWPEKQSAPPPEPRAQRRGDAAEGALAGLRVVDLTAFWAGPFATNVMALFGADVIKIESTRRPDGMRFVNCHPEAKLWEGGSIFHGANTGKRSVTLDLDSAEGMALLRRLIERADLLVENFSVRVLDNFGLDMKTLHAWNPKLVVLRMPAWGLDGPWRGRTGFAMNVEQASGIAWRAGYKDQPMVANVCDPIGSLHAVIALFAALEERKRRGRGALVEAPLAETALHLAAEQVVEYSATGVRLEALGNRGPDHAPQGIYRCRGETWLALSVATKREWSALCAALRPFAVGDALRLLDDAALAEPRARQARHDELDRALNTICAAHDAAALAALLREAGVPAEPLINGHCVMPNPQLEARGFYQWLEHPLTGGARYPGLPWVGLADGLPERPPPTLGQHNREVLCGELGLPDADFEKLCERGVVGDRPAWVKTV